MAQLLTVILPVFLLIAAGYVATRTGSFPVSAVGGLMNFTQRFAFPCLLFRAVSGFDISEEFHAPLLLTYYLAATICFALGAVGARLLGRNAQDAVVIGFCCLFSNTLMMGLPITERAFGPDALEANFAIIAMHAPFCYTLGILAMELVRARETGLNAAKLAGQIGRQVLRNPLVIALMAGFVVNLAALPVPEVARVVIDMMATAAVPAALFAVGGVLVQYKLEGDWRLIVMICAITLAVHPALVWIFGSQAGLAPDAFRSALITAAVAPGINAYVFSDIYDRAKRTAASSVLITTSVSLLTIWFWLGLLP
ncbi:AEC family transporter [Pseudooceanicola aestuarii]|uniref:AEC family transporter n=1 Tax=Pseudooceanicola aestuarii TaxID=2697319 RepID=UPI0013D092EF|nr:AEC family transporter [Pseudooceanicola aestuarii]